MGTLKELEQKGCMVVKLDHAVVAVFFNDGKIFAVENRCPHMGFLLHRGSVQDGILTCYWHHARFDLASGCTFHLWADDVPKYPVEMRGNEIWVLPREPRDEVGHWRQRLKDGMQHYIGLVMGKATLALLHHEVEPRDIVRQAALFGACYRDDWASGMTILAAMANMLPHLERDEKFLPLWHGVFQMAHHVHGAQPHWDRQPLETDQVSLNTLKGWLRHWTLVRHRDGAERCLLTAIASGDFHTYQMLEAAIQQYREWQDTEQGRHILIAATRYIAAHSPTQRQMLQTADIVQRLHRGEDLHESGGVSRYY